MSWLGFSNSSSESPYIHSSRVMGPRTKPCISIPSYNLVNAHLECSCMDGDIHEDLQIANPPTIRLSEHAMALNYRVHVFDASPNKLDPLIP